MVGGTGGSAAPQVKELESFQRKSAAIETVFTLAVLYVSVIQIYSPNGVLRHALLIPVAILLGLALKLGGGNLLNQLQSESE